MWRRRARAKRCGTQWGDRRSTRPAGHASSCASSAGRRRSGTRRSGQQGVRQMKHARKANSQRLQAIGLALSVSTCLAGPALAQEPMPAAEGLRSAFPAQQHYSPYAGRNFPTRVFWGDTHVHTAFSMDAGAFGARLTPEDAYRFARGEELTSSTGQRVKLSRPLDFLVVADHSDNMGFFPRLFAGDPSFLADPTGRRWYDMIKAGGQEGGEGRDRGHRRHSPRAHSLRRWPRCPARRPIARRGKRPSRRRRSTTTPAGSARSSATSGPPTPAATICIAW